MKKIKLSSSARKLMMSGFRKIGSRSTEWRLRSALMRSGISGWQMNRRDVIGTPDFWFSQHALAIFVDGCFWHGCSRCCRIPQRNQQYWNAKIAGNTARDRRLNRALSRANIRFLRIWEHDLASSTNSFRVIKQIQNILSVQELTG